MGKKEVITKIKKYTELVKDFINPKYIVLYGSYATGTANKYSDIDIAVVVDKLPKDWLKVSTHLVSLTKKVDVRIEPILICEKQDRSGFLSEIFKTGKIIYKIA